MVVVQKFSFDSSEIYFSDLAFKIKMSIIFLNDILVITSIQVIKDIQFF